MKQFDLQQTPLQDVNLIEASAGTGKTFTLAGLYLRLILESELTVDQILVVTYTRAATQELRDRLRKKLSEARSEISNVQPQRSQDIKRLDLAIQSFDEAAIYTIHSFCQQVLKDFAFESGSPFEMELIGDDRELLQAVTDDFWRKYVVAADSDFSAYLLANKQTPDSLLQSVRGLVGKPYLHTQDLPEADSEASKAALSVAFQRASDDWQQQSEQIIEFLISDALKKNSYKPDKVAQLIQHLTAVFSEQLPLSQWPDLLDLATREKVESSLKKDEDLSEYRFWSSMDTLKQCYVDLHAVYGLRLQHLRLQLLAFIRERLPEQKLQQQVQSYDDLLINLSQALHSSQGDWLTGRLRQQFKAALVDEFQDTDPVQYAIFQRLFAADSDLPVFFVGDPKQAIYSFRGADIFTYLNAKQAAQHAYTLTKNWRSHPSLIAAINQLFQQSGQPFIYSQIPFYPVDAARPDEPILQITGSNPTPLEIIFANSEKPMNKGENAEMAEIATEATADQIADLLNQEEKQSARLVDTENQLNRGINGGDIAVLVPKHKLALKMQQALRKRGVNSVQLGKANVFASQQAVDLQCLLLALSQPDHPQRLSTLLAGPLFQHTAADIYALQQDEARWDSMIDQLQAWQRHWQKSGFMAMFRAVLQSDNGQQRLLSQIDGERQLTNFLHLAELIQAESVRQQHHIETVNQWLSRQRTASDNEDEATQLRLESDANLVKVITVHASKGLEYPIVFCPYLWTVQDKRFAADIVQYHDPEQLYQAKAALCNPDIEKARILADEEAAAQALRLLYVALTRARERCVLVWGNVKDIEKSALYRLLHGDSSAGIKADLQALSANSGGNIAIRDYQSRPMVTYQSQHTAQKQFQPRPFTGNIQPPWRIGSFSLLSRGHLSEQPDYDAELVLPTTESRVERKNKDRFTFDRGRQAGNFLHTCLENIPFDGVEQQKVTQTVARLLPQFGFDPDWQGVVTQWLQEVLNTPIDQATGLRLADIPVTQRINEMAFYFPVAGLDVPALKMLLQQTPQDSIWQKLANDLHFQPLTGFMKGFIDLVFEYQGRFYIADYKSNHLGNDPESYQGEALENAMLSHRYPLQYLIYSLALHRHLQLRLPDYDPEQHFGGVFYLFLRGMQPKWPQSGVYFDALNRDLLLALDTLMAGGL